MYSRIGLGHSLGMDVHDVPSASKPDVNPSLANKKLEGHEKLYDYLRLRLVLEEGMIVVCFLSSSRGTSVRLTTITDRRTWDILPPTPLILNQKLSVY